jgi:hypothetical protein
MIDLVQRRPAAHNVIRNVFGICRSGDPGRHISAGDLEADSVATAKKVGGRQYFDGVFDDFLRV